MPAEPPEDVPDGVVELPGVVPGDVDVPGVVVELVPGTVGTTTEPGCELPGVNPGVVNVLPGVFSVLPGVVSVLLVVLPGVVTPVAGDVRPDGTVEPPVESPEGLVLPDVDGTEVP